MTEHPTRFTLALRSAGDLPSAERAGVDAHLAECAACGAALAEIERDRAEYEGRAEAERGRLMAAIADAPPELRTARRSRHPFQIGVAAAVLAAATIVAAVVVAPGGGGEERGARQGGGEDAFKGGLAAQIFAERGSRQFAVRHGDTLEAGDALRFVVTAPASGYVAVLSVEQAGRASAFYPSDSEAAAGAWPLRIERPGRSELPGSIILDDALGMETYVILFSKTAFSRGEAERAARALATGRGDLPHGLQARALGVRKVARGGR